jgi:hypothetical protein
MLSMVFCFGPGGGIISRFTGITGMLALSRKTAALRESWVGVYDRWALDLIN